MCICLLNRRATRGMDIPLIALVGNRPYNDRTGSKRATSPFIAAINSELLCGTTYTTRHNNPVGMH